MDVRTATDTGGWKLGGGSVVVDSLFNVAPFVCLGSVVCPSFVMHYLVFFLVCNHIHEIDRAGCFTFIVFLMPCAC